MKTHFIKTIATAFMISLLTITIAQEDKKLDKAEQKFCTSITNLISSLETLDQVNQDSSVDEFNKAYKDAEKSYNKFVKAANKLEKVEIKESQQAYNKLVDSINKIDGDTKTADAAGEINDNIDSTSAEINDILTVVCQ
jgi:hypothetical protein